MRGLSRPFVHMTRIEFSVHRGGRREVGTSPVGGRIRRSVASTGLSVDVLGVSRIRCDHRTGMDTQRFLGSSAYAAQTDLELMATARLVERFNAI